MFIQTYSQLTDKYFQCFCSLNARSVINIEESARTCVLALFFNNENNLLYSVDVCYALFYRTIDCRTNCKLRLSDRITNQVLFKRQNRSTAVKTRHSTGRQILNALINRKLILKLYNNIIALTQRLQKHLINI